MYFGYSDTSHIAAFFTCPEVRRNIQSLLYNASGLTCTHPVLIFLEEEVLQLPSSGVIDVMLSSAGGNAEC